MLSPFFNGRFFVPRASYPSRPACAIGWGLVKLDELLSVSRSWFFLLCRARYNDAMPVFSGGLSVVTLAINQCAGGT